MAETPSLSPLRTLVPIRDEDDGRTKRVALLVALVLHLLLITVTLPSLSRRVSRVPPEPKPLVVTAWVPAPPELPPRPPNTLLEKLARRLLLVPDPTPPPQEPVRELEDVAWAASREPGPEIQVVFSDRPAPPPSGEPILPGFGGVSFPVLIEETKVLPVYPPLARRTGITGTVLLEAVVRKDGTVGDIRVLRSPGARLGFDEAAIDAVRQWRYHPGIQNGRPVDVLFTILVEFVLE